MVDVVRADASVDVICDNAFGFLHLLDPIHGLFVSDTYMFRGVSSEKHDLVPSAHRTGAHLLSPDGNAITISANESLRIACGAEFYVLERFFYIAARHGVRLPEDSFLLREQIEQWRVIFQQNDDASYERRVWPSPELYSLIALAQHHGIPTRAGLDL